MLDGGKYCTLEYDLGDRGAAGIKDDIHRHAIDSAEGQCHEIIIMSRAMLILTNTGRNGGIGIIV